MNADVQNAIAMIDDMTLLRQFSQESSQEAFAELVRRHIALVYSAALRCLGDSHLAEDVTQTVFSGLAQKAASLRIQSSLTGWLYCRARSTAIDVIRSEQRRRHREQQALAITELSALGPTASDWDRLRPELEDTIEELNESDRDVVLLRFFERQSFSEIGALLKISEDTAQKRADRALEKMRAVFARRGITSTTAAMAGLLANQAVATVPAGLSTAVTTAALASATSVGALATAQSILSFMSTTKLGLGIAGMVTLFAVGSAVFEGNAAWRAQTSLAATQAALAAANAEHKYDLERQQELAGIAADDDKKWAALQKTVAEMQSRAAQDTKAAALAAGQAFLAAYPQARPMLFEIGKAQIARNYAAFFKKTRLTPAQIENLENQTDQQWIQTITVGPNGIHPGDEQLPDDQLKSILGDQGFQQFQDFERVQPLQGIVNDASSLSTSAPITETQANQLLMILANASSSYQGGGNASAKTINWDQVMVQAQGVLSAQQIAAISAEAQLGKLGPLVYQFRKSNPPAK
jgi:RNA polymerase sigma factor (sigma-70 family)